MIKQFKLIQNEHLEIKQNIDATEKESTDETKNHSNRKINKEKVETYAINFNEHILENEFEIKIGHLDSTKKERQRK